MSTLPIPRTPEEIRRSVEHRTEHEDEILRDPARRRQLEGEVLVYLPCDGGIDEGENPEAVSRCTCGLDSNNPVPALPDDIFYRFRPEVAEVVVASLNHRDRISRGNHIAYYEDDTIVVVPTALLYNVDDEAIVCRQEGGRYTLCPEWDWYRG